MPLSYSCFCSLCSLIFIEKVFGDLVAFSPLNAGLLTDKYLSGIPSDSRAGRQNPNLAKQITPALVHKLKALNEVAQARGQTLAQMALTWALRDERVTSVIIGASQVAHIEDNVAALDSRIG